MKSKDIFEQFDYEISDETLNDEDFSDMGFDDLSNFVLQFNPIHVQINPDTIVDLVQNARVINTMPWNKMIEFINTNFDDMNGTYNVSENGMVLFSFDASSPRRN